jgi:tetratricopeptide (TPR) repeat protein
MKKVLFLISIAVIVGMFAGMAYAATPEELFKVADDVYKKKDVAAVKANMKDLEGLAASNEAAAWRFGRASYFVGARTDDAKTQEGIFSKGYKALEPYFNKGTKDVNTNYWFALNAGKYGKIKGVLKSLFLVKPMKTACNNVVAKDPGYEEGGAYTILGALEYEVPGGDLKKGIDYFNKALKYNADGIAVNLYLGKSYYKQKEYAKAKERLEFIIANGKPETKDDKKDMAEAKELLVKVIKDMK